MWIIARLRKNPFVVEEKRKAHVTKNHKKKKEKVFLSQAAIELLLSMKAETCSLSKCFLEVFGLGEHYHFFLFPRSFLHLNINLMKLLRYASLALILLFGACQKDRFLTEENNFLDHQKLPEVLTPYDLNSLSEEDQVRNAIAQAIGHKIHTDEDFRAAFFDKLVYKKARATKEYFVLDFLQDRFGKQTGAQVVDQYLKQGTQKALENVAEYIAKASPDMVVKIPQYVESYFWAEAVIQEKVSIFANSLLTIFPETSQPNDQGFFLGYGDPIDGDDGLRGVQPGQTYDGYIPIHIKKSRQHLIINQNDEAENGLHIKHFLRGKWTPAGLGCLDRFLIENTVPQDFLPPHQKLINYPKLLKEVNDCILKVDKEFNVLGDPAFGMVEDCANGIDDDGDGLIDGNDPDCLTTSDEICDNGVDDDGDGLTDSEDPNCLSCPGSAAFYRDCDEDFNSITGVRFNNINYYFDIYNQILPGVEDNVNLRFDFFYLTNIPGCTGNCPLDHLDQRSANPGLMIFVDPDINSAIPIEFDDEFEEFYSPGLNSGNPGHFIVRAQLEDTPPPYGSRLLGRIAAINFFFLEIELEAYLINTNWVPMRVPYMNIGPGNWDANLYGDQLRVKVTEVDPFSVNFQQQNSTQSMNTVSWPIRITGKIGKLFGLDFSSTMQPLSAGYTFGGSETKSGAQNYTLSSDRIYELGDVVLTYQDSDDDPRPVENNFSPYQLGQGDNICWGLGFPVNFNEYFYYGSNGGVNLLYTTPLTMIDLIKIEE